MLLRIAHKSHLFTTKSPMEIAEFDHIPLRAAFAEIMAQLDAATMEELFCAIVMPLLALFIGARINRFIDSKPHTTMGISIIDFSAPLLSPLLAILFSGLAVAGFKMLGAPLTVLPFVVKLAVAWFAIQLVAMMSSKQTAGWFIALVIIPITLLHLFGVWDLTVQTLSQVEFSVGNIKFNLYLIIKGIMAIAAMQWVASFLVNLTDRRLRRINVRDSNRSLILKIFQFLLYSFIFLIGIQMLGINLTALSVFSGALGVGLGFGLQKIASNFISGIILLFEKSIEVGDLIEMADGTTGFVRQTFARYTLLETPEGKDLLIPNEEFINLRVISWTHSSKKGRVEIEVCVDYQTDIELARSLMLKAATAHPRCCRDPVPMCTLKAFTDHGIAIQLFFWVADVTEGRMEPKSDVMITILHAFREQHIHIAYPRRDMHIFQASPGDSPLGHA